MMTDFKKLFPFIKPYKNLIILNFIFNGLSVTFSLFSISLIIPVLSILFGTVEFNQDEINKISEVSVFSFEYIKLWIYNKIYFLISNYNELYTLGVICFFIVVFSILKNLFRYLALFFLTPVRNNIIRDLRNKLNKQLLHFPISFFQKYKRGDILSRITIDLSEIEWSIISLIELLFKDPIHIILFTIGLSMINIKLTLLCLIIFPITGFIIAIIGKNLKKKSNLNQEKIASLISQIDQNISGIRVIKSFNKENFIYNIFKRKNEEQKKIANTVLWKKDLSSPMSEMLSTITMVIIIWFGGEMVLNKTFDAEAFIGFTIMFSQIIPPAKSLTSSFYSIKKGGAAINRIYEFLENQNEQTIQSKNKNLVFSDKITFSKINFSHENKSIIKNLSMSIRKGEKIAIVGESGSGKSTLIDLLLNFYQSYEGQIHIDSKNSRDINLGQLRNLFGLVSQNVFLFNDSLINNICFGNKSINLTNVMKAAKNSDAHNFISKLPNGYETIIKNHGENLSSGEKQRISIARAIYGDYPILIFDEPTSSLDSKSSNYIHNVIQNIDDEKTCIFITHKLQYAKYFDCIFVIKNGEIIDQGKHDSLIESSKYYKGLYNLTQNDE